MTDNDLITAWGAGIFEGEGTIFINGSKVNATVQMTDRDILERLQNAFGGKIYDCKKQKEHHKDSWRWALTSTKETIKFLKLIRPLTGSRRSAKIDQAIASAELHRLTVADKQKEQIKAFLEQGLTHQAMADKLGCSRSNVSHTIRRMRMVAVV